MDDNNKFSIDDLMRLEDETNSTSNIKRVGATINTKRNPVDEFNFTTKKEIDEEKDKNPYLIESDTPTVNRKKKKKISGNFILFIAVLIVGGLAIYLLNQDTSPEVCMDDLKEPLYSTENGNTISIGDNGLIQYEVSSEITEELFLYYMYAEQFDVVRLDVCYKNRKDDKLITKFILRNRDTSNRIESTNLEDLLKEIGEIPLGKSVIEVTYNNTDIYYDIDDDENGKYYKHYINVTLDNGHNYKFGYKVYNNDDSMYHFEENKRYSFDINVLVNDENELEYNIENYYKIN